MKTRSIALTIATTSALLASAAFADGGIKSRSADDAYNDMMRHYNAAPAGTPAKQVMTRSADAAHADMIRDWDAKPSSQPQKQVLTQTERAMYRDLMRADHAFAVGIQE
ncbi:MAG: hypothetical protein FJY37_12850 [Betaproteobacteria bacterium]|nr:hypothetical protein [Betaproteobacteria bacterium]